VIRDNLNFFWDIGSPYKGKGDFAVSNTAMLCASVFVLCLKSGVSCFFVWKLKVCVSKEKNCEAVYYRVTLRKEIKETRGTKKINKATKKKEERN
jgi:hypothetical protein